MSFEINALIRLYSIMHNPYLIRKSIHNTNERLLYILAGNMKRRNLSSEETKKLRLQLEQILLLTVEKWQSYWYPLCTVNENVPVVAFGGEWLVNAIKRQFENYTKYEMKRFIPTHERNYDWY